MLTKYAVTRVVPLLTIQVACDLRAAFEALHAAEREPTPPSLEDHLFLILDKSVQAFPWESIPCLIGRSISRVPSISFLRDRIDLAAHLADPSAPASAEILVDSTKTTFVLNAAGDLKNTQGRFDPWLERMVSVGWSGVVGRVPMEEEVKSALVNKELFLCVPRSHLTAADSAQLLRPRWC